MKVVQFVVISCGIITANYVLPILKLLLIRGTRATSKTLCTGVFLSNRNVESIAKYEMLGFLDKVFTFKIDRQRQYVTSSFVSPNFSKFVRLPVATAVYRGEQFGCQLLPIEHNSDSLDSIDESGSVASLIAFDYTSSYSTASELDEGTTKDKDASKIELSQCVQQILKYEFTPEALDFNHTRAVVVMHRGRIVGEGYQQNTGFQPDMRLLGWSMTKSVISALIGVAIGQGILTLDTPVQFDRKGTTSSTADNNLARISRELKGGKPLVIRDLLQMSDVLEIAEDYGFTKSVVGMIYTADSAAQFAVTGSSPSSSSSSSSSQDKVVSAPHSMLYTAGSSRSSSSNSADGSHNGEANQHTTDRSNLAAFEWYYSSAVSNLLAHQLRIALDNDTEYHSFPHKYLFSRLGATSFAIETDPDGGFIGSSFSYATARDWALLGELFLRNGSWNGEEIIPAEYVNFVQQPHPLSGGHYGGHFWLNPARVSVAEYNLLTAASPGWAEKENRAWMTTAVPADAYFMAGFQGQYVMILPSRDLVVARLGLTTKRSKWNAGKFFGSVVQCLEEGH